MFVLAGISSKANSNWHLLLRDQTLQHEDATLAVVTATAEAAPSAGPRRTQFHRPNLNRTASFRSCDSQMCRPANGIMEVEKGKTIKKSGAAIRLDENFQLAANGQKEKIGHPNETQPQTNQL